MNVNVSVTIIAVFWAVHPCYTPAKKQHDKKQLLVTFRVPSGLPKGTNEQQVCDTAVIAVSNGTLQLPYYLSKE